MSNVCSICGKGRQVGFSISHAHNKSKKVWKPNVQKVRSVSSSGMIKRITVCTRCIRSGCVVKPVQIKAAVSPEM